MTAYEMGEALDFLRELAANNHKAWMDEHRLRYKLHRGRFEQWVEELVDRISVFDGSVSGLKAKECTYRMNRDIRFSNDKSPYKTHFSAFIAPGGKNSGLAGYYLHLEPVTEGTSMIGRSILAAGQVCFPPAILRSIREEIVDHGEEMMRNIAAAKSFVLDTSNSLKRLPVGFEGGEGYDHLLKLKDHCICLDLSEEEVVAEDFTERIVELFRTTKPYLDQLNRAIRYRYEEQC